MTVFVLVSSQQISRCVLQSILFAGRSPNLWIATALATKSARTKREPSSWGWSIFTFYYHRFLSCGESPSGIITPSSERAVLFVHYYQSKILTTKHHFPEPANSANSIRVVWLPPVELSGEARPEDVVLLLNFIYLKRTLLDRFFNDMGLSLFN